MKKWIPILAIFICLGCLLWKSSEPKSEPSEESGGLSLASFYYAEDQERYPAADVDFHNVDPSPVADQLDAVELAKLECTVPYNTHSEYYDASADMWRVDFFTYTRDEQGFPVFGDTQHVYLDGDGITRRIAYEERDSL